MLTYRAVQFASSFGSLSNYTNVYLKNSSKQDNGSFILISGCTFINLNMGSQVTALAAYSGKTPQVTITNNVVQPFSLPAFIHKGIVLNIEDFGGQVEILNSNFYRNMHFIPAIYYKY